MFHEVKAIWSWLMGNNLFPFKVEIIGINKNTKFDLVIWYLMHNCVYMLHSMHICPNVRYVISYQMSQSSNLQMCDQGCPTRFKMKWFATKKINVWQEPKDSKSSGGTCKSWGGGFSPQMPFSTSHILQYLRTNLDYLHGVKPHNRGYPIPCILII